MGTTHHFDGGPVFVSAESELHERRDKSFELVPSKLTLRLVATVQHTTYHSTKRVCSMSIEEAVLMRAGRHDEERESEQWREADLVGKNKVMVHHQGLNRRTSAVGGLSWALQLLNQPISGVHGSMWDTPHRTSPTTHNTHWCQQCRKLVSRREAIYDDLT